VATNGHFFPKYGSEEAGQRAKWQCEKGYVILDVFMRHVIPRYIIGIDLIEWEHAVSRISGTPNLGISKYVYPHTFIALLI
jgi:hypothetical protein